MKCLMFISVATMLLALTAGAASAADIVVVDRALPYAFFGLHGSQTFADQPEKLFFDLVQWGVSGASPDCVTILLFTQNGTLNDDPANVDSLGFYNLLTNAGYAVLIDHQNSMDTRTDYSGFDLVIYPNLNDRSAANVINSAVPFITMEPGQSDELGLGTGVSVFNGVVNQVLCVDNGHVVTQDYGLGEAIGLAQNGAPTFLFNVATEAIETTNGRVLIGQVPEPATILLMGSAAAALGIWRRRRTS